MPIIRYRFVFALITMLLLALCALLAPRSAAAADDAAPSIEQPVRRLDGVVLQPEQVAAAVGRLMAAGKVTGLALAVLNDGEIVYRRAFGLADVAKQRPLDERTVMYAASITKAMFAYLVMQLAENGAIDLDTSIERYLPKPLPAYEKYADLAGDERWRKITPRMLLSHTSGLPNWRWFDFDAETIAYDPNGKLRLRFDPGARYGYSGEGINLLQFVLEAGLGLDVGALMQTRVFDRFGMDRTSMVWREDFRGNFARGYGEAGDNLGHKLRESARAAGSADSDLVGLSRFLRGMLRGEGVSATGYAQMFGPQVRIRSRHQFPAGDGIHHDTPTDRDDGIRLSYGLGWGLFETPHGRAVFKEGHDDGWENYMLAFPDAGTGIVILTNSSNGEGIFKALLAEVIGDVWTPWQWCGYVPYDAGAADR